MSNDQLPMEGEWKQMESTEKRSIRESIVDLPTEKVNVKLKIRIKSFITGLYQLLWIRIVCFCLVLSTSFINLVLSWLVFKDTLMQQPGLVYDKTPATVIALILVFNTAELLFFALDITLWTNILWNEPDTWFLIDLANVLNIFISEIPLGILNAYLSACHESTVSISILVKASILLLYLVLRFITLTVAYFTDSTEDGYVDIDRFEVNEKVTTILPESPETGAIHSVQVRCLDVVRRKNLRRFWLVVRILVISGFFIMFITNILIFKFTFVQTYHGYLEWRRIGKFSDNSLEDSMSERYFHDVEIFLKETELPTRKWLHLVSLEKLMQLQRQGVTEQIGLSYIKSNGKVFSIFSQFLSYPNKTTETSMTCWSVLSLDSFQEAACEDVFEVGDGSTEWIRLKSLKITFIYQPPTPERHLGGVYYSATRTNINGTVYHNIPLNLQYFQNTIAHELARSKNEASADDAAYNHDGWNSGPFRPMDLYLTDRGSYVKYDLDTGDLLPVGNVWKTGFAMCSSSAPTGPLRAEAEIDPEVTPNRVPGCKTGHVRYAECLLPYCPEKLDEALEIEWSSLKQCLCKVLASGDFICDLPAILRSIRIYTTANGFRFKQAERIALLRLSLSLACCPNLDHVVSANALDLANCLLRRIWTIPTDKLQLDWSIWKDTLSWFNASTESRFGLLPGSKIYATKIVRLVGTIKRFFPPSSIEDIWIKHRAEILSHLLRQSGPGSTSMLRTFTSCNPKCFNMVCQTWLPDLIDMWYIIPDYGPRFHEIVKSLAYVAIQCRGRVDWEPHLERIFSGLFRGITLPKGPTSTAGSGGSAKPAVFTHYAKLLVNAIGPDGVECKSTVIGRLERFYQALAPFYHPSNTGMVTTLLAFFTRDLVWFLYKRLRSELTPLPKSLSDDIGTAPPEFNLTVEQVDQLVNLLLPITVDYMLFCKLGRHVDVVLTTIDFLARLRPRLVMPKLLTCLEDGLARPEAPSRYTRPLHALILTVASFSHVRFPVFESDLSTAADSDEINESDDELKGDLRQYDDHKEDSDGELEDDEDSKTMTAKYSDSKRSKHESNTKNVPMLLESCAHVKAFLYPEGHGQLVRLLNILLSGFDPNHSDRFNLTIACLSRLFLSIPLLNGHNAPTTDECSSDAEDWDQEELEDTVLRVFSRILDHLTSLNDRSSVASGGGGTKSRTAGGYMIQRPHAAPDGPLRVASDAMVLSNLSALTISIAMAAGANPRFRCTLIRLLSDMCFTAHWEPDVARLLAWQIYWLAVNSRNDKPSDDTMDDTAMFALRSVWPRLTSIMQELSLDSSSMIHRGRAEPRLITLLYVLSGPISAVHPAQLVDAAFFEQYTQPLLTLCARLLSLSTGRNIHVDDKELPLPSDQVGTVEEDHLSDACPALAEAASSLLTVILRRLTTFCIDFTRIELTPSGASHLWTPFVTPQMMYNQSRLASPASNSSSTLWHRPTVEGKQLATRIIKAFLRPILQRLDEIQSTLSTPSLAAFHGFNAQLPLVTQRDQLTVLLIWLHNIFTGLADNLAPRLPDLDEDMRSKAIVGPLDPFDMVDVSFYDCILESSDDGLRAVVLRIGSSLLETVAKLFSIADDSLMDVPNRLQDVAMETEPAGSDVQLTADSSHTVGQLFTDNQIDDLMWITHTAAFNLRSFARFPCVIMPSHGAIGLFGPELGSYACLGLRRPSNTHKVRIIPGLDQLFGTPCHCTGTSTTTTTSGGYERKRGQMNRGRLPLSWLTKIQMRHLDLITKRLRWPLTFAGTTVASEERLQDSYVPTRAIRQLIHSTSVLATAPRRSVIRQCASAYLVSHSVNSVATAPSEIINRFVDRLETDHADIEKQASMLRQRGMDAKTVSNLSCKLIAHRRLCTIRLLLLISNRMDSQSARDDFIRLKPSVLARMWVAIAAESVSKLNVNEETTDSGDLRFLRNTQDQLEQIILDAFSKMPSSPMNFIWHFPPDRTNIPDQSWLGRVYTETTHALSVLGTKDTIALPIKCNPRVLAVLSERHDAFQISVQGLLTRCFPVSCMVSQSADAMRQSGAGQAVLANLLRLSFGSVDAPLTPPWLPNCILPPPPPPHCLGLVAQAVEMLTSREHNVAIEACGYVSSLLYVWLIRHQSAPIVQMDPKQVVSERTGSSVPTSGPLVPAPRSDNTWLLFDPQLRPLVSEDSYRAHHHIGMNSLGYIYYPSTFEVRDPYHRVSYPVFTPETGKLDETRSEWLQHLDPSSSESAVAKTILSYLASKLASPGAETRQLWMTLADRLLNVYRRPGKRIFDLSFFLYICSRSFGPSALLGHVEAFLHALLPVKPDGEVKPFDGVTEIVGCLWLERALKGLSLSSFFWPREWIAYYLARFLPRALAIAEVSALSVSTSDFVQTAMTNVHPDLAAEVNSVLLYAGNFAGPGTLVDAIDLPESLEHIQLTSNSEQSGSKRTKLNPQATVSQSQAGGPVSRLSFVWNSLFAILCHSDKLDMALFHPLWDWIDEGIRDCAREVDNQPEMQCSHSSIDVARPGDSELTTTNDCPVCLLRTCLPLAHRRVFYARLCSTFVTYMGERGLKMLPHVSSCFPLQQVEPTRSSTSDTKASPSPWFMQASDDSVWIREMAASFAIFRAAIAHLDIFYTNRVPLQLTHYASEPPVQLAVQDMSKLKQSEVFLRDLIANLGDTEPVGAEFMLDVFLPQLIRDTLDVLHLKGCQPSAASLALVSKMSHSTSGGDWKALSNTDGPIKNSERDIYVQLRPLTNRLRCMYACLPSMLIHSLPVTMWPDKSHTADGAPPQPIACVPQMCIRLAPLLADVCSVGSVYKQVAHNLRMGAFDSAGFAGAFGERVGDAPPDGLDSGLRIVLHQLSLLPLAGQGDPEAAVTNCLALTEPFLTHASWKTRGVGLLLLRNLIMLNLSAFWELCQQDGPAAKKLMHQMRQHVLNRLVDQWLEVRQLAMHILAVLIQVGLIKFEKNWTAQLIRRARTSFVRPNAMNPQTTQETEAYHTAIRERHAGVLGLAAFICAHPHTTPDFLPDIIVELTAHVNDPHPIERTVRDTLSAYSRSHQDNWHEQRGKFTDNQMEEYLAVVSAAAYYV